MIKKLSEFYEWLDTFINFEKTPQKNMFWLDVIQILCDNFNQVQNSFSSVHIAGSKGKGSVAKMISCIIFEAGYKCALYSSPHILDFKERISLCNNFFHDDIYIKSANEIMDKINSIDKSIFTRNITWFELVTLYAFLCFKNAKVDWAVFEVGLGGRLDATNVIMPDVCCITPIELEHTEYLGDTIEKIAAEKSGIIKKGVPVVVSKQIYEKANEVIKEYAIKSNSKSIFIDDIVTEYNYKYTKVDELRQNNNIIPKMNISFSSPLFARKIETSMQLLGDVQLQNAITASVAVKTIFPNISEDVIERGLSLATLPARFEITKENDVLAIYDGAHTVNSISNTIKTLKEVFPNYKYNLLFSCASDKEVELIAKLFNNLFSDIVLTIPGNKEHNFTRLENAFKNENLNFVSELDLEKAISLSFEKSKKENAILLITGSFYLISFVKTFFKKL